jgi:putative proteasome-type protease
MTYCAGLSLRDGLVMLADTRTNAGIDDVAHYRKLHVFEYPGKGSAALAAAGNLSITQTALSLLAEGISSNDGEIHTLETANSMFHAAQLVGTALRIASERIGLMLSQTNISAQSSFLFGGRMHGGPIKLYLIYGLGNFIECTDDSPFFQIGEHKYGRPILARSITYETSLSDALKLGLISLDSTMRSNLAVGMPIDVFALCRDSLKPNLNLRIEASDPYFCSLSERWSQALKAAHNDIPPPPYAMSW